MGQLKRAHSSSRLMGGAGIRPWISSETPQAPNPSSLVLPNDPGREEISAGDKQAEPHPQSGDPLGSQILYLQVGGHCFPYKTNKSSKKELGKASRAREMGGGRENEEKHYKKTWGEEMEREGRSRGCPPALGRNGNVDTRGCGRLRRESRESPTSQGRGPRRGPRGGTPGGLCAGRGGSGTL